MKIVADAGILDVASGFQQYGELVLLPGREIKADDVRDADALIVRSITPVDARLLSGSRVRFVATATSGTDHLDLAWLGRAGIVVADAAGCNANAVAAYVEAAVQELSMPRSARVLVIGAGHVGTRVLHRLRQRGMPCRVVDPLVEGRGPAPAVRRDFNDQLPELAFTSLDAGLETADLVSLHVPFTVDGRYPTRQLLDARRLEGLAPGTVLINTARGEVLDEVALKQRLRRQGDLRVVLDVFRNEPEVDRELVHLARMATPHIAGYSRAAKQAATAAVREAFVRHFHPDREVAGESRRGVALHPEAAPSPEALTQRFRDAVSAVPEGASLASVFDALRRERLADRFSGVHL